MGFSGTNLIMDAVPENWAGESRKTLLSEALRGFVEKRGIF